ncbi:unnamed protein product [Paramecium primaurelia]|uniref:WD40-repeat-containing domain n=1 Tax=Paramecium primaurelia TaxID=5886 RepID=A0A8S1Q3G6_PARPR|nr:unnamed protein product [Paramecium primaurelia]
MQIRCTQADHRNQQIIGFCIDSTCQSQRPYCNFCLPRHSQHLEMLTSIELLYEWIKQGIIKIKDFEKNVQEFKVALDSLNNMFLPYLNFNIQRFPQLGISEIDKLIKDLCEIEDYEKNLFKQLMQSIEQGKSIVNEIRRKKKNQSNFEQNNHLQIQNFKIEKLLQDFPFILKPFSYELIKENSIKQNDDCFAIALNKNCQILAASCGKQIKIYEFKQGKLKLQQVLNEHRKWVSTLNFMKKQNQLISGDGDGSIIFWSKNNNNQWDYSQIIKAHNDSIRCLILNTNEDMIVSSGGDNSIKFWIKQNEWICQQIITNHNSCVCQLSLNDQENIVISCGMDKQILVIQYSQQDQKWIVIDNIKTKSYGDRICFINNQYFAFQPSRGEQIHIYELNSVNNKFDRKKDIFLNEGNDFSGLFPQQFIKSKQLLLNKHYQYIYLIRKTQNDEFKIEQSIEFSSTSIYGYMSDDGEYLITWDDSSKEIQIRKYQEK